MADEQVKPIQEWSAAELRAKLNEILTISGDRLSPLIPILERTKAAAEAELSRATTELERFSLAGELDAERLAILKQIFSRPLQIAVTAAQQKVFVADQALRYVKTRLSGASPGTG